MASPAVTVLVVLAWYSSNIGVLILNKFLLSSTGFRFPVFLSLCHMMACAVLSLILHTTKLYPAKPIKSREQLLKIALLASIFCMTIVLGNASLRYLPVSFNQAVGSSTPFFTAFFSYSMQGIREARTTYATLIPIATGVVIASGGEPLFHLLGFIFCLTATAGRALKSVVQAMLMADPNEKLDPMSLLMYMASISVVILVPTSLLWEPQALKRAGELMAAKPGFVWWLLGNSMLAYFVNLTNFMVTKYTSALTLQVLGNAKGVVAALISLAIFKNPVTVKGAVGYAITVAGVILYSESKKRCKAMQEARSKGLLQHGSPQQAPQQQQQESIPLLNVVTLDFGGKAKDSTA